MRDNLFEGGTSAKKIHPYGEPEDKGSFFVKNKMILYSIIICVIMFLLVFFFEKSKSLRNFIPTLRGEITLSDGLIITTIRNKYPILIRKDDPKIGDQLRFFGNINSIFSDAAMAICSSDDKIVEVGAKFGFNTVLLGKRLNPSAGRIYSYEPNATIFKCLRKTIYLNELENFIELRNIAMKDHIGACEISDIMTITADERGRLSMGEKKSVACSTIDEDLRGKRISILLVDLPGQEFLIVNNARKLIEDTKNLKILVSFRDTGENGSEEQTLDYLTSRGYSCYEVTRGPTFTPIDKAGIMEKSEGVLYFSKEKI